MQFLHKLNTCHISKKLWGMIIAFIFILLGSATNADMLLTPKEYQVKAAYLFNFSKFIRWPVSAFNNHQTPIRICVLGKNPFGNFETLVKNKIVKKRNVVVELLYNFRNSKFCHILFISKSEQGEQATILAYTRQYPILTVSDIDNFVERGGMVQFFMRTRKVRFKINPNTLKEADLSASTNLFRVAKIVK